MSHISYSELKDWKFCPFYHKLTRVEGIDGSKGNEYTAFGTAIHDVCENVLLHPEMQDESQTYFELKFVEQLGALKEQDVSLNEQMIAEGYAWPYDGGTKQKNFEELRAIRRSKGTLVE